MTTKPNETAPLPATLKPGSFPLGSPESRAAARAMLNARKTEGDGIDIHIEVCGFGPDPNCPCRACREKWSKATPGERTAARLRLENYLGAFRGDAVVVSDGTAPTHDDPIAQSIDAVVVNDKGERVIDPRPDRAECQDDKEYTDMMAQWFIRQSAGKRASPTIVAVPPEQKCRRH